MITRSASRFAAAAAVFLGTVSAVATVQAAGINGAPAPFDKGGVKIALVGLISAGDFFEAVQSGAQKQAKALDVDLRIFPGHNDPAEQRNQVEQAINLGVSAIIIDHGHPESLKDVAQQALDKGIKVVAFDVNLDNPKIPQIEQSDRDLATTVIQQALAENGKAFEAGYVYVPGFAPLDRRDAVWKEVKAANPGIVEKARFGAVDNTTAATVADQAKAALRANPGISVVVAPYDEFARGAKLAVTELGLNEKVKIYSADVSTADLAEITENGSPWVATAATNPAVIGAVSVRAAALLVAGQDPGHDIVVKPTLLKRADLLAAGIKTVEDLNAKFPAFGRSDAATAAWIPGTK